MLIGRYKIITARIVMNQICFLFSTTVLALVLIGCDNDPKRNINQPKRDEMIQARQKLHQANHDLNNQLSTPATQQSSNINNDNVGIVAPAD